MNEKELILKIIDVLNNIYLGTITIDDAEQIIFSPRTAMKLKNEHCNEELVDIIYRGCELEDIESLIPEELTEEIKILINMAEKLLEDY